MRDLITFSIVIQLLYVCVLVVYVRIFFGKSVRLGLLSSAIVHPVLIAHIAYIILMGVRLGHPPFTDPFESLTTLALLVSVVYAYIEWRTRIRSTGALIFFFVLILQTFSNIALWTSAPAPRPLGSHLLNVHISLALLGYTAFCFSFLYSVMYLILHDEIKKSRFGLIYQKMPSLEQLDDMNYRAAVAGTCVLLASITVGFVWAWTAFNRLPFGDIKVLVTIGIAAIYGATIIMKRRFGWGGERIAILSTVGFMAVLGSLLVVNVFAESFHSYF